MSLALYAHPFSSYCQKVLVALYEGDVPFEYRMIEDGEHMARLQSLWPMKRFPLLVDGDRPIIEATTIIEFLDIHRDDGIAMIPRDPALALDVRMLDRFLDNYVSTPQQKLVADRLRPEEHRDPYGVAEARRMLETAYAWLDVRMATRAWAAGNAFSLADCGAAPFLFYAHWSHPIAPEFRHVHAYRERLLARPSFARAVEEARPYRNYFPLDVPDAERLR